MCIITEIVTMKIIDKITNEEFINIVDYLEKNFHSKQPGFIDTELLFNDKSNEWIMIQHWDTINHLKAASTKIFNDSEASVFVKCIDPKNIKMTILPQLKKWH